MATQTTGLLTSEMKTYYSRRLLRAAEPTLVHCRFAQKVSIPQREGKGPINFRRFEQLTEKTTPLVEGVTPPSDDLTITTVEATPLQYGGWIQVSDVLSWTAIDPVLDQATERQGTQAGATLDSLCRDVIVAGTTVN
jgi:N4-gp56 family major capsid protein